MESKKPLEWLKYEMPHIPANGGQIALYEVTEALDQYADYINSTLIAEHNMMKEALENMEDAPLGFNFRLTAKETLKKLGR